MPNLSREVKLTIAACAAVLFVAWLVSGPSHPSCKDLHYVPLREQAMLDGRCRMD